MDHHALVHAWEVPSVSWKTNLDTPHSMLCNRPWVLNEKSMEMSRNGATPTQYVDKKICSWPCLPCLAFRNITLTVLSDKNACPRLREFNLTLLSMADWLSMGRLSYWPHYAANFQKRTSQVNQKTYRMTEWLWVKGNLSRGWEKVLYWVQTKPSYFMTSESSQDCLATNSILQRSTVLQGGPL